MLRRAAKRPKIDECREGGLQNKGVKKKIQAVAPLGENEGKDCAEHALEQIVLGGETELLDNIEKIANKSKGKKKALLPEDRPKPVWQDDDDETDVIINQQNQKKIPAKRYRQQLRNKFEDVSGAPSWAKLRWEKSDSEESEDDTESSALLQSTGNYLRAGEALPKGVVQMKRCEDANQAAPAKGKLHAIEFHPSAQVMLAAGSDHTLRLFQVDGKTNPLIQSVFVERFPIMCAHFTGDGTEVIMSSLHRSFYYYDMIAGKVVSVPRIKGLEEPNLKQFVMSPDGRFITFLGHYGYMHLVSTKSKEWIGSMKMNGSVEAVTYTPDGSKMLSHGDDGQVYVWDMTTRDCVHRFYDDGTIKGTAITASPNGQYIATGSYSGVVNVYDDSCLTNTSPRPLKAIMNQTSPCTGLAFNSTSEILATASNYAERAVRLVHFPSITVFSNFPDRTDPLRIPLTMNFSLNSGYFAVGSQKGTAQLYRVKHYSDY